MKSPLIGITTGYHEDIEPVAELPRRYVDAVLRAGGAPSILAPVEDEQIIERYAQVLDGLVISGGRDIPPALYGEQPHERTDPVSKERPLFEIALVKRFRELDKPVLGICYGCQLLNVAFGGNLIQDIPSQVEDSVIHRRISPSDNHATHPVYLKQKSLLQAILSASEVTVVSSHHQAVKRLAPGFRVTAYAPDKVIEAIELEDARFVVGVQWHPEMDPDAEATDRLMRAFLEAASSS